MLIEAENARLKENLSLVTVELKNVRSVLNA